MMSIIRDVPHHLVSRTSWRALLKEPAKCFRYVFAPILFVSYNWGRRSKGEIAQTVLNRLVDLVNSTQLEVPIEKWPEESDLISVKNSQLVQNLTNQFVANNSDKHLHGYSMIYQVILTKILEQNHSEPIKVVEIGIGSNNPKVPSNMGVFGTPGASLRAFRDFLPIAQVVGGDIDTTVLFSEPGIATHFVDQRDVVSLRRFFDQAGLFDLFVEDGLHELDANLNSLCIALEYVKPNAWIVIEDIDAELKKVWLAVAKCLESRYRCWVIQSYSSVVFVAQRR